MSSLLTFLVLTLSLIDLSSGTCPPEGCGPYGECVPVDKDDLPCAEYPDSPGCMDGERCLCIIGYTGDDCTLRIEVCPDSVDPADSVSTCYNGGTCVMDYLTMEEQMQEDVMMMGQDPFADPEWNDQDYLDEFDEDFEDGDFEDEFDDEEFYDEFEEGEYDFDDELDDYDFDPDDFDLDEEDYEELVPIWRCDCSTAEGTASAYAGHQCRYPSTSSCLASGEDSDYAFCANAGKCKHFVEHGDFFEGCVCTGGFQGRHCQYENNTAPAKEQDFYTAKFGEDDDNKDSDDGGMSGAGIFFLVLFVGSVVLGGAYMYMKHTGSEIEETPTDLQLDEAQQGDAAGSAAEPAGEGTNEVL